MSLTFEPKTLHASDEEALLVLHDQKLVAIIVRLSEVHLEHEGEWYIEWASQDDIGSREIFHTLDAASDWISNNLHPILS